MLKNDNIEMQSYEVLSRFRVKEGDHSVHYYEVKYEDGTIDTIPGEFAIAIRDEDKPCEQCGSIPRKIGRRLCQKCLDTETWGENVIVKRNKKNETVSVRGYSEEIKAEVFLERSSRAKRLLLTVKPIDKVRVAVPPGESFHSASNFAIENHSFISNWLDYYRDSNATHVCKTPDESELLNIKTKLKDRVVHLATLHNFHYNKLTFKSMYSRWGSCSKNNNINLNILMYQLSDEIQDYLILHELMHTKIRNHGKDYWQALDKIIGDSRILDRKLKYNYLLYKK